MKKRLSMFVCFISILCVYIIPANAQSTVLSAGIEGIVGTIGEIFPDDSDHNESKINNKLNLGWGFFGEVKFLQSGNWFHDIYFSYERSKGAFSYEKYNNNFTAESYTAMYRIGGFTAAPEYGNVNFFLFADAGLALDRYLSGDFSNDTNSMLAGKPYLVRPVFGIGGGLMFEHVTINILELRFDIRFQHQPQDDFQDYLNWDADYDESSHWPGAMSLYSGIAYNF